MTDKTNGRMPQDIERLSIFELGGKLFALDIYKAREVIPLPRYTPLPNSEEIYLGVFNLRGEIFPLVDVSPILGLSPKKIRKEDMVIVVDLSEGFPVGLLIDKVLSVHTFSVSDMKTPRGVVSKTIENYLKGIFTLNNAYIHKLDLDNIYRTQKLLAHF